MRHGAQDIGRYDFFKDVERVERFRSSRPGRDGAVIFLTNDGAYWKAPVKSDRGYADFAFSDGGTAHSEIASRARPGAIPGWFDACSCWRSGVGLT